MREICKGLLLLLSIAAAQVPPGPEDADYPVHIEGAPAGELVLHVGNFDTAVERYNSTGMLIEFFLPWCGHSRRLRPEYKRAAAKMAGKMLFARVDCSSPKGAPLCSRHEVLYHPTIVWFGRGLSYEYTKRALASELVSYAQRMMADSVAEVSSLVELTKLVEENPVLVLGFHSPDDGSAEGQLAPHFATTADNMKDQLRFASVSHMALLSEFGISSLPQYLILRRGLPTKAYNPAEDAREGETESLSFGLWVADNAVDLVQTLTQDNYYSKIGGDLPGVASSLSLSVAHK